VVGSGSHPSANLYTLGSRTTADDLLARDDREDRPMSATTLGAVATAGVLGVTHALEPDHVAGISALTSRAGDSRLSAIVGVCFSVGHVALVVAWLALAAVLLGHRRFPAVLDTVGTLAVVVVLGVLGTLLSIRGYRAAARAHEDDHHHDHEPHLHLPLVGTVSDHAHTRRAYLRTGLVGALFTLSPPLSMIAFLGTVLPTLGLQTAAIAVLGYAVGITLTMAAIGAGVGSAVSLAAGHGRTFGIVRLAVGLGVLSVAAWMLLGLVSA
jgi:hypothetical protein